MTEILAELETAAHLLALSFGGEVFLGEPENLTEPERYSRVQRIPIVGGPAGAPKSVILKGPNLAVIPEAEHAGARRRFLADWAGSQFLDKLDNRISPGFFGGSRDHHFLLLEDLGEIPTLVEPFLEGSGEDAEASLARFMTAIGNLHADTVGREADYLEIAGKLNGGDSSAAPMLIGMVEKIPEMLEAASEKFDISVSDGVQAEMEGVLDHIRNPGAFKAYIHSDVCPDNLYDDGHNVRLIDFETGGFGHALVDAAYPRMAFPTCWCANETPDHIVDRVEGIYREALARGVPEAADDALFYSALADACGFWLMVDLAYRVDWALKEPSGRWGIATIPSRLASRTSAFAGAARRYGRLPALSEYALKMQARLQAEWPEYDALPYYPAYSLKEHGSYPPNAGSSP